MYKCEYCNRYLKEKHDKCPACGSTSFKKVQNYEELVIKTPPKDGYKVNLKNFEYEKKGNKPALYIGIFILIFVIIFSVNFALFPLEANGKFDFFVLPFILFAIFALIAGISTSSVFFKTARGVTKKSKNEIHKINKLAKNGILIKNLKYELKPKTINGSKTVYQIKIIYEIEKGKTKCFLSEPKYLTALGRDNGTVDLLIDPDDYNNYFIDFEIY